MPKSGPTLPPFVALGAQRVRFVPAEANKTAAVSQYWELPWNTKPYNLPSHAGSNPFSYHTNPRPQASPSLSSRGSVPALELVASRLDRPEACVKPWPRLSMRRGQIARQTQCALVPHQQFSSTSWHQRNPQAPAELVVHGVVSRLRGRPASPGDINTTWTLVRPLTKCVSPV